MTDVWDDERHTKFARALGFKSYHDLMWHSMCVTVLNESEGWFITELAEDRYAAWDDRDLDPDKVRFFPTFKEAHYYQYDSWRAREAELKAIGV